ncbi:hypothetical protein CYK00_03435 [Neisseria sicca]|uniref:Gamma-butyrobetaine hydroxylase-like N-terminal domain-containing protein n=1 Tax=Neisseria sicca TaxID=490 RepID=A0A2I1XDC5_NEISI|nr:DUF971 domain-containing protein [Neisseria sicca]PLA40639.1 hypothetical protein CYK00_03435 [Neisseria sicca]
MTVNENNLIPTEIRLSKDRASLTLRYDADEKPLSAEFLRVYSPSAEVRGHGVGQEVLQTGKASVTVADLEPVGNYALKITFSDGHNSGLYDWAYLHKLAHGYDALWANYLRRMELAGASRIPSPDDLNAEPKSGHTCGSGGCGGRH